MRRHSEIGYNAVDVGDTLVPEEIADMFEVASDEGKTFVVRYVFASIFVAVESVESALVVEAVEDCPRMPATAESAVDVDAVGLYG